MYFSVLSGFSYYNQLISSGQSKTRRDRRDGQTDGHGRRPVCPVGDGTAKTDVAVVEAKWDTNRNLPVVTHVVRLHV